MKKLILIFLVASSLVGCKAIMKGAAKYWTKKQIKEFVASCEEHAGKLMSNEKATHYCDCAVDKVAEKYQNFDDFKKAGMVEVLKIAKDCKE